MLSLQRTSYEIAMYLQQKPDKDRNLNLSPFVVYVLIDKRYEKVRDEVEKVIETVNSEVSPFKCEMVDFDAATQRQPALAGNEIDIFLYLYLTTAHIMARVFPISSEDYTFLPDLVDDVLGTNSSIQKLEKTLGSVCRALRREFYRRLEMAVKLNEQLPKVQTPVEAYLDGMNEEDRALFLARVQETLGYSSPDDSRKNFIAFLNYRYEPKPEHTKVFIMPGTKDFSAIKPNFHIEITYNKTLKHPKAHNVAGAIDILMVPEDNESDSVILKFYSKYAKMTYLLILLAQKYSIGLHRRLFENEDGKEIISKIWYSLYRLRDDFGRSKKYDEEYKDRMKYPQKVNNNPLYDGLTGVMNHIKKQSLEKKTPELNDFQRYYLSVENEDQGPDGGVRKIKLPSDRIHVEVDDLKDLQFPDPKEYIKEA